MLSASNAGAWMSGKNMQYQSHDNIQAGKISHSLAELYLRYWLGEIDKESYSQKETDIKSNPEYSQDMEDNVKEYTAYVQQSASNARLLDNQAIVSIEQTIDLSQRIAHKTGRADAVIMAGDTIEIIDLKYGKSQDKASGWLDQLKLYAVGVCDMAEGRKINNVYLTVLQPRRDYKKTDKLSIDELLDWASNINTQYQKAVQNNAHNRSARRYHMENMDQLILGDPAKMTDDQISKAMQMMQSLEQWQQDVRQTAKSRMLSNDHNITGCHLTRTNRPRRYKDMNESIEHLSNYYDIDEIAPRELLSIGKLTDKIGKHAVQRHIISPDRMYKPEGNLKAVADS